MISVVSWAVGPTSAPVIPKTFHNPGTPFDGGGGGGGSGSGYGSAFFDGTGDSLDVGTFTIGTDPFTIENWFQPKFNTNGSDTVFLYDVSSEDIRVTFKNGNIRAQLGSETELSYSIGTLDYNTWYYTALQRDSSGNVNFYFDGAVVGNYSASGQNVSGNTLRIGDKQAGSKEFHGYISNFRIVKGNALYPPANGGSASFDGTGDYIDTTNPLPVTDDFTIEGWVYPTTSGLYDGYFSTCLDTGASGGIVVGKDKFFVTHGGGSSQIGFSSPIENNVWSHIALQRSGNVFSLYKDGSLQGTTTVTVSLTGSTVRLGSRYTNTTTYQLNGFLSNFRIVTGTTVYSGASFTPPTSPLTAISGIPVWNTQLLTCQNGTGSITDASSNNYTITPNGNTTASGSSPFAKSTTPLTDITNTKLLTCNTAGGTITDASSNNHTVTTNGDTVASGKNPFSLIGSTVFDGSGDYLAIANSQNFYNLGTADWTIEFWAYFTDVSVFNGVFQLGEDVGALSAMLYTDGKLKLLENDQAIVFESNQTFSANKWYHCAYTNDDSSNTQRLWVNGIAQTNTGSKSTAYSYGNKTVYIGGRYFSGSFQRDYNGYISNFRIVSANLYPTDSAGGSAVFDGTDDYLKVANNTSFRLGTGDFTIECWVYFDDTSLESGSNRRIFNLHESGNAVDNLQIVIDDGGYRTAGDLFLYSNSIQGYLDTDIRSGWHHIAVVRNSGTLKFYLDGVSKYSASNTQDYSPGGASGPRPVIGSRGDDKGDYNGYISNFRMVVGTAVYTSNFTVPTTPLTDITNTQLLTCQNYTGSIDDESSNAHVISDTGNVSATYSSPFVESKSPLTAITNTQLLTCQNSTGAITDASSNGYTINTNGNAQPSTDNPFYS